ncbi:MAG TPA: glycosyl transferase family 2 [Sphingobacteriaceae bacterium]|nr:glycosyl transferase family 2 [Sphingobacteriaceae bacterium]
MILYYLIFFFLILRFTVTLFNFISNPKLTPTPKKYNDLVSILIHEHHHEQDITKLLESILQQDYQNFEVIVLDDHCDNRANQSSFEFSQTDSRFQVIKSKEIPKGWVRKNFVYYQLANMAKGKYFMFLSADTIIANGLINNTIHRMKMNKLALLSLFPNQLMVSFGERIVVPLMNFILLNMLPVRLIHLSKNPAFVATSGQFMLFDAANYHHQQWHKQVKSKLVSDTEIMKLTKTAGYPVETLLANGYITCRMYKNFKDALNGFSKILLAGFNNNIAGLLIYLLLVILGPIYIGYYLDMKLLFFAFSLIILSKIMISLSSEQNTLINIILHPLQILSLLIISVWSVIWYIEKKDTAI